MRGYFLSPVVILALAVNFALADRATFDPTKTQIALFMETPPTIDGILDQTTEWQRAGGATSGGGNFWLVTPDPNLDDGIRGGTMVDDGPVPLSAADLNFNIYAGYDSENLYIGLRVRDDSWQEDSAASGSANGNTIDDDGVEVFVDGDNSNFPDRDATGTNPEVVDTGGQYAITVINAYREVEAGNPGYGPDQAWYAQIITHEDWLGYDAEFRISLAELGNPQPGDIIGLTVVVNDDDDGGAVDRQVIWAGAPHTEVTYGNLLLGRRSYNAPMTSAPVVDGQISVAEYPGAEEIKVEPHTAIWDSAGDDTFEATDASFSAWVVHDAEAVYVAIDVTDDAVVTDTAAAGSEDGNTWEDDSVEIFFDADLDRELGGGALQFEGQYVFTPNGAWRDAEANNPTFGADADWFAVAAPTDHGYQVEAVVKKSALLDPEDGTTLGFHLAMNDDDGAGRKSQPGWSGRAHSEFTYGTLTLGPGGVSGTVSVDSIVLSGQDLELAVVTSDSGGTLAVQQSAGIAPAEWSDVAGVAVSSGPDGTRLARFPKPASGPMFYRAVLR